MSNETMKVTLNDITEDVDFSMLQETSSFATATGEIEDENEAVAVITDAIDVDGDVDVDDVVVRVDVDVDDVDVRIDDVDDVDAHVDDVNKVEVAAADGGAVDDADGNGDGSDNGNVNGDDDDDDGGVFDDAIVHSKIDDVVVQDYESAPKESVFVAKTGTGAGGNGEGAGPPKPLKPRPLPVEPMTPQAAEEHGAILEAEMAAAVQAIQQSEHRKRPAAKSFLRKEPPSRTLRSKGVDMDDNDDDDDNEDGPNSSAATGRRTSARRTPTRKTKAAATTKTPTTTTGTTSKSKSRTKTTTTTAKQARQKTVTKAAVTKGKAKSKKATKRTWRDPMVSEGKPDEPFPGVGDWPAGWIKRVYQRQAGASKGHCDRYWYTPVLQVRLRSMLEVKRWLAAMKQTGDDEEESQKIFRSILL